MVELLDRNKERSAAGKQVQQALSEPEAATEKPFGKPTRVSSRSFDTQHGMIVCGSIAQALLETAAADRSFCTSKINTVLPNRRYKRKANEQDALVTCCFRARDSAACKRSCCISACRAFCLLPPKTELGAPGPLRRGAISACGFLLNEMCRSPSVALWPLSDWRDMCVAPEPKATLLVTDSPARHVVGG